ncbi:MAG: N-acetylmuramoyl-L-alanine amidase [Candidatus Omnitrophica bacterium]|nr:N-acetylmuramoyl-L-alanine amidase [Candidatus Omnitrophota bacterium]
MLFVSGCATVPLPVSAPLPGISLNSVCDRYNVAWQFDGVTQVVLLEYKGAMAKALVGSPVVLVGKEKVILSAPLRRRQGIIYVPEDFESRVLAPFGGTPGRRGLIADMSVSKIRTIVIDPGHGGKDPGASVTGTKEKNVVLDIAKRLRGLLEGAGFKVIMTRARDEFVSLAERTAVASRPEVDLFVSIHANSNPSAKTRGVEAYYVRTVDKKDLDEDQRRMNEKAFAKNLNMEYSPLLAGIVAQMMYDHKIYESRKLAEEIAGGVSRDVGAPNRGARASRFFVVRNTVTPAVLVETGFLTNAQEEQKLNSGGYRQRMAEAITRSIIDYATAL